jgi:hypothetical protein
MCPERLNGPPIDIPWRQLVIGSLRGAAGALLSTARTQDFLAPDFVKWRQLIQKADIKPPP